MGRIVLTEFISLDGGETPDKSTWTLTESLTVGEGVLITVFERRFQAFRRQSPSGRPAGGTCPRPIIGLAR